MTPPTLLKQALRGIDRGRRLLVQSDAARDCRLKIGNIEIDPRPACRFFTPARNTYLRAARLQGFGSRREYLRFRVSNEPSARDLLFHSSGLKIPLALTST